MIRMLGAMVDAGGRAEELVGTLEADLVRAQNRAKYLPMRPRVFFEEWDDPLISGIGWVSELIELARRHHIFCDHRNHGAAKDRIVRMEEVVERAPRSSHRLMVRREIQARARCGAAWLRAKSRLCRTLGLPL
jgi:iron complex transport system substrate-binding protein